MKLWKILTYFVVIFLGLFYASSFGHSFMVIGENDTYSHNHNLPDHEVHHGEDTVCRGNYLTYAHSEYFIDRASHIYPTYDHEPIPDRKYTLYRQKIFDKQSFFFSDTIRLLL